MKSYLKHFLTSVLIWLVIWAAFVLPIILSLDLS